jgi:hypothetical protein
MAIRYLSGINVDSNTLFVDSANNRVGVGTASPAGILDIIGDGNGTTSSYSQIHVRNSNSAVGDNVAARITFNGDGGTTVYGFIEQRRDAYDSLAIGTKNSTSGDAGYVGIYTRGTEKIRITGVGNVGIGTTSPSEKLEVSGTSNIYGRITSTNGANAGIRFNSSGAREYGIFSDGALRFYDFTAATERMRITSAGNVGIGTTNPTVTLEVSGRGLITSSGSSDTFAVTHSSGSGIAVNITKGGNGEGLYVNKTSGSGNAVTIVGTLNATTLVKSGGTSSQYLMADGSVSTLTNPVTGTGTTNYVPKWTSGSAIGNSQIFDNGTNVGIGTTSPSYKLDILGKVGFNTDGTMLWGNAFDYGKLTWDTGKAIVRGESGKALSLGANGTQDYVYITTTGNVGIGTTSPGSKLDVISSSTQIADFRSTVTDGLSNIRVVNDQQTTASGTSPAAIELVGKRGSSTHGRHAWIGAEGVDGTTFRTQIKFKVRPEDSPYQWSTLPTQMVIDGNGNVGINTTSPVEKLDVRGGAYIDGGTNNNTYDATLYVTAASSNDWGIFVSKPSHDYGIISQVGNGAYYGLSVYDGTTHNFVVKGNGTTLIQGNVGIGTTNPGKRLVVTTASNDEWIATFTNTGTTPYGVYIDTSTNSGTTFSFATYTNAGTGFFVRNDGYVGIGTTSPQDKLEIKQGYLRMYDPSSSVGAGYFLQWSSDNGGSNVTYAGIDAITTNAGVRTGDLRFFTSNAGGPTEKMRIKGDGKVGIGTTIPGSRLQVTATSNSATTVDNGITILNDSGINNCLAGIRLSTYGDSDGGLYPKQFIGAIRDGDFGAGKGSIVFCNRDAADTSVVALSDEKMRILPNGNVGIATTAPISKLHIDSALGADVISISDNAGSVRLALGQESSYTGNYIDSKNIDLKLKSALAGGSGGNIFFQTGTSAASTQVTINVSGNVGIGTTSPTQKLSVEGNTDLGNSIGSTLAATYTTRLSGYALYYDASNRYGNYGVLLLNADTGWTSSSRRFMITNGYNANRFAIIRSVDATTDPSLGYGGSVTSGTVDFEISSAGAATFGSSVTASSLIKSGGTSSQYLMADGSVSTLTNPVTGTGTTNYVPKWTSSSAIGNSQIFDNGTNVGIGTTSSLGPLNVAADGSANAMFIIGRSADNAGRLDFYANNQGSRLFTLATGNGATELYGDANIPMVFSTNGTERLRILAGGNVGIGTTSPGAKLDVNGTAIVRDNMYTTGALGIELTWSGNTINDQRIGRIRPISTPSQNPYAGGLAFDYYKYDGSAYNFFEGMRLNGSGNVGIGTTSPYGRLHLTGDYNGAQNTLNLENNWPNTYRTSLINFWAYYNTSNPLAVIEGGQDESATNAGQIVFKTMSSGAAPAERMRITPSGNVGIGTTSPDTPLFVQGGPAGTGSWNRTATLSATYPGLIFNSNGTKWGGMAYDFSAAMRFWVNANNNDIFAGTLALSILNNGNVGIGTTNPTNKLQVSTDVDNAYAVRIQGETNNAAGVWTGIGIAGESANTKTAILFEDIGVSYSRGKMHFALNNAEDQTSATPANAVMTLIPSGNVGIGATSPSNRLTVYQGGGVRVTGIASGDWIEMSGNLPGYSDNQYPVIKSNGSIHFANNNKYSAFLEGANTYFGILDNTTTTRVFLNTSGNSYLNGGNVGINITSPTAKLHVEGPSADGTPVFRVNGTTAPDSFNYAGSLMNSDLGSSRNTILLIGKAQSNRDSGYIGFNHSGTNGSNSNFLTFGLFQNDNIMNITGAGNVGIGTTSPSYKLDVVGDARITSGSLGVGVAPNATDGRIDASNDIVAYQTSDQRLKENVTPIENALEKVKSLTGVEFDWIEEHKHIHGYEGHDTGIIAQQVQSVMPTAVRTNDSGYLSVRYEKLIGLLIEANKELAARVEELEKKLK